MYVPSDLVVFQLAKVARIKIFITLNASDLYVTAVHSISSVSWRKFIQKNQLLLGKKMYKVFSKELIVLNFVLIDMFPWQQLKLIHS